MSRIGESKSQNPLPKTLPGVVLPQLVCCGKPSCKCASRDDEDLHGPYYYRFWREEGRLKKEYIPLDRVEAVRAACERRQAREAARRARKRRWMSTFRAMTDTMRDVEAMIYG